MKTDFSKLPREEVEARITMMLVGELSADEARELMEFVAGDAELMRVHDELKATIGMVREATAVGAEEKISEGKREGLLASFKVVPVDMAKESKSRAPWMELAVMAACLALLATLGTGSLRGFKSRERAIVLNLPGGGRNEEWHADAALDSERSQMLAEKAGKDIAARGDTLGRQLTREELEVRGASAPTAGAKIELPAIAQEEESVKGKVTDLRFDVGQGQARGFGAGGGGAGRSPERAGAGEAQFGFGVNPTAGERLQSFYSEPAKPAGDEPNRFNGRYAYTVPSGAATTGDEAKNSTTLNLFADSDVKKADGIEPLTGLPVDSLSEANNQRGLIDPLTGLPGEAVAVTKGKAVATGEADVGAQGGMGGGSAMSMQYYMANPELMKRYFPQMYAMMERGRAAGGAGGAGTQGMPGMPAGPSASDMRLRL